MPRTHGYARKGRRCYGFHAWNERGRVNVIGAQAEGRLLTTWLCNFNVDSDVFHTWITGELLPILNQTYVIVMDNATFHKRKDTQAAILSAGHTLQYLPPYSPDLNPIEKKWAHAKAKIRKLKCTVEQLFANHIT